MYKPYIEQLEAGGIYDVKIDLMVLSDSAKKTKDRQEKAIKDIEALYNTYCCEWKLIVHHTLQIGNW